MGGHSLRRGGASPPRRGLKSSSAVVRALQRRFGIIEIIRGNEIMFEILNIFVAVE